MCFSKTTDIKNSNEELLPGNRSLGGTKRPLLPNDVDFDAKAASVHSSSKKKRLTRVVSKKHYDTTVVW